MLESYCSTAPEIGQDSWVHPSAVVIGRVRLADGVSVWPCAVIRGDVNDIVIGTRSNIQDGAVVHATHASADKPDGYATYIGDEVTVGHNAIIHGCTIADRVLIGMGATILDGAHIDSEVMIAANALVPMHKTLASGFLYVGSPAKAVRPLTAEETAFLSYSAKHYSTLKKQYER